METKKWYQSKIVLLSLSAIGVSVLFFAGLFGATPEQIEALQTAAPEVAKAVEKAQQGENILGVLIGLYGTITAVFRVWSTAKPIAK